jgi:hypothetical protein
MMMIGMKDSNNFDWHEVKTTIFLFIWLVVMISIPLILF